MNDVWLERARALAPVVEGFRAETERERCLPPALFERLREEGFFSMWVPASLGGHEVPPMTMFEVVEEFSRQEGSVGWNVMIAGNDGVLWGYMDHEVSAGLMGGNPSSVIAGTILGGAGTATRVEGGYELSGRWPFASGCHHADWMVASGAITENGEPVRGPDGTPQVYAFILPVDQCELLDTWYTAGLRGTGSTDFRADRVFVPEGRYWPALNARGCDPSPLYNTALPNLRGPNIAGVALGIARDAIDTFLDLASFNRSSRNPLVLAQHETVQARVGQVESLVRSARAFLLETMRENWATLSSGQQLTERQSAVVRLAAATAVQNAVQAVDTVYAAAGSASIYALSRLERCFRDVHIVPQHAVVGPNVFANVGRSFLGRGLGR